MSEPLTDADLARMEQEARSDTHGEIHPDWVLKLIAELHSLRAFRAEAIEQLESGTRAIWAGVDEINRLRSDAAILLEAAKLGLKEAESWAHDQLDGTGSLEGALRELEPIRAAIAKAEGK